ncbi:MAG TPA: uL15m family ribosomal protein [Methanomicrobiales archaeon]|jgi:large subunit ribosomal protein L15|nr:uL15m family ribosomal protein [Methanomicrobiales archaeon]
MPSNKRSKYRGSRTCGGGTHKNRRNGGSRGGRGFAGGCKHHFVRYYLMGRTFGKDGFSHDQRLDPGTIDVGTLEIMAESLLARGLAKLEGDTLTVDASALGVGKILGSGRVTRKMKVSAGAFSEAAKKKLEASGGQALVA